jgi:hypothetical protein
VEQCFPDEYQELISSTLDINSLVFDKGLGPAGARNVLLKKLYESDSDWLLCMDDDRDIYNHYGANQFLLELSSNPALIKLAKQGVLIKCVCPQRRPFKKENTHFDMIETAWNLQKGCLDGCVQICFIPNIVKYGKKPVWFDETNDAKTPGRLPEDIQFDIDWVLAKNQVALNLMFIMRDYDMPNVNSSVIYDDEELRAQCYEERPQTIAKYLRLHTKNRFSDLRTFNARKNGFEKHLIPRTLPYTAVQSDYGKYRTIEASK